MCRMKAIGPCATKKLGVVGCHKGCIPIIPPPSPRPPLPYQFPSSLPSSDSTTVVLFFLPFLVAEFCLLVTLLAFPPFVDSFFFGFGGGSWLCVNVVSIICNCLASI